MYDNIKLTNIWQWLPSIFGHKDLCLAWPWLLWPEILKLDRLVATSNCLLHLSRVFIFFLYMKNSVIQRFKKPQDVAEVTECRNYEAPCLSARKQYLQTGSRGRVVTICVYYSNSNCSHELLGVWDINWERPQLPNKAARWDTIPLSCCCKLLGGRNDKRMKIPERIHAVQLVYVYECYKVKQMSARHW